MANYKPKAFKYILNYSVSAISININKILKHLNFTHVSICDCGLQRKFQSQQFQKLFILTTV